MLNNNLKFCASIRYALNTKAAVIDEETALQYKVCRLFIYFFAFNKAF